MRRSDLLRYFRKHYRPDNLIVSVAGDITHARVMKTVKALSRRVWPGRPQKRLSAREEGFEQAPKLKEGLFWVTRSTEQAHIVWGVETPKFTSRDQGAILLIAAYLGGGMSSALFQSIREEYGLAYSVYSSLNLFFDSGVLNVYVGSNAKQVPTALRLIEETASRLSTQKLTEEELQEVKDSMKGTLLMSSDNVENGMNSIAIDEIYFGTAYSVEQACRDLDEVTTTDIRRVSKRLFGHGKRSVLVYGPRPSAAVRKKLKPTLLKR